MIFKVFNKVIMITGFIFIMMLIIEYINVQTRGFWQKYLKNRYWTQYLFAALLGAIPGCLGAFTVVALYSHGLITFGALVAAMIATSGDESFVMLAMFPEKALLLFFLIFLISIAVGLVVDKLMPDRLRHQIAVDSFPLHEQDRCICFPKGKIIDQLRHPSMERSLLIGIVIMLLSGIVSGNIGPDKWNWISGTLLFSVIVSLFIVSTVPDHFLKEHLWNHVLKVHIPKIFFWTLGTLMIVAFLMQYVDVKGLVEQNMLLVLLLAVIIGLIPESGPHMIFVSLYFTGAIPFSILLASSIVQDGHGMIPLLAESKRAFIAVKLINMAVGLISGLLLIYLKL